MNTDSLSIPLGTQSFRTMRSCNEVYVDKTRLICELAKRPGKYLLTRPRRFGKSLLVSTLASLFSEGLKHFEGLAIEKLWKDRTYDVVSLCFAIAKGCTDPNEFKSLFEGHLLTSFAKAGFVFDNTSGLPVTDQIADWLASRPDNSLVLLVDEYDAPLTAAIGNTELLDEILRTMRGFFKAVKRGEGCLRFMFVTAITRFAGTGMFSDLGIRDITFDSEYGELLGFTRGEIERHFGGWLNLAKARHGLDMASLLDRLDEQYGGYCFDDRASTRVLCPWSVLCFFDDYLFRFDRYWMISGGHSGELRKYLAILQKQRPAGVTPAILVGRNALLSNSELEDLDIAVLLHQAGYLTIGRVVEEGVFELRYPNKEIAFSMPVRISG